MLAGAPLQAQRLDDLAVPAERDPTGPPRVLRVDLVPQQPVGPRHDHGLHPRDGQVADDGELAVHATGEPDGSGGVDVDRRTALVDERGHRLHRPVHQPQQHVGQVGAAVHEHAAARQRRVLAPRARRAALPALAARHRDGPQLAQLAAGDLLAHVAVRRVEPALVAHHDHDPGRLRRLGDLLRVGDLAGERLLAEHVQAPLDRAHDDRVMERVGRDDGDRVQVHRLEHLVRGRERRDVAEQRQPLAEPLQALWVRLSQRDDLELAGRRQPVRVAGRGTATADHANPQPAHSLTLPNEDLVTAGRERRSRPSHTGMSSARRARGLLRTAEP